jgi:hypothetical protein
MTKIQVFFKYHIFVLTLLIKGLHTFGSISESLFYDPRISQIEKFLLKFCPKFLDLYVSIYGN